ncbi:ATP-binding protein [Limnobacter sp.]|uniref:ATP-binding protein n=1 Tax=Limnobacter sp. TaxID=2003368 RepID=UPI003513BC9E
MALNEYLPHGFCINWDPFLLTLHVGSDLLIALAYFSIPVSLIWISRRQNLGSLQKLYYLFAAFILACGVTHLIGVVTLWAPLYLFEGYVKAVTAAVSVATAIILIPKLKDILSLPNLNELIEINNRLKAEVANRERIQGELQRSMEDAVQARNTQAQFLANMSHEIRTPMNGVVGASELLLRSRLGGMQSDLVRTIHASSQALLSLLNDILDISRLENGDFKVHPEPCEMEGLLDEVGRAFSLEAERKKIELLCPGTADAGTVLEFDRGRLRQILFNLVGNALKFTDEGQVSVKWSLLDPFEAGKQARLCLTVQDTGIGIPVEQLELVFERFKQALEFQNARNRGGTGLGLAIVHEMLVRMGGNIEVESEVGVGSIFTVTLPVKCISRNTIKLDPRVIEGGAPLLFAVQMATPEKQQLLFDLISTIDQPVTSWQELKQRVDLEAALASHRVVLVVSQHVLHEDMAFAKKLAMLRRDYGVKVIGVQHLGQMSVTPADHLQDAVDVYIQRPIGLQKLVGALHSLFLPVGETLDQDANNSRQIEDSFEGRVVLAEDSMVNQKIAVGLLRHFGCEVVTVSNGALLLEYLRDHSADLIFMDGQMPVMDGYEATAQIRKGACGEALVHIPIVAMTANAMAGEKERCIEAGMDGYLSKPINVQELIAVLRMFLKKRDSKPV